MHGTALPETTARASARARFWSLRSAATTWFAIAAFGQVAFVWMILAHYGANIATDNLPGWNEKPLIKGYVPGDGLGNVMLALHVMLAAVVTVGGLLQLVPAIRARFPTLHRWTGRTYLSVGMLVAVNGLWLTWVRETYLSSVSAVAVSLNGLLILAFGAMAWACAWRRDVAAHRRWALRAFMVISGVWFLRVGIMAWVLLSGGGMGMTPDMAGPADIVLNFGSFLIPLAVLELYLRAQRGQWPVGLAIGVTYVSAAITLVGVGGAIAFMWGPYMI